MAIQQRASGLFARVQSLVDRVVSPTTRRNVYTNISQFSSEQPFLASFLALQFVLSFTPLALFLSFSIGVLLLALVSALLFSFFWIGVALLILLPTLFVTVSLGIAIWVWAVSSFLIARWIYNILPVSVRGTTEVALPNGKRVVVDKSGEGYGDVKTEVRDGA